MNTNNTLQVAKTIGEQLGGLNRVIAMTGAKNFVGGENSLQFKLPRGMTKVSCVRIVLTPADTYTVEFYKGYGLNLAQWRVVEDVYADALKRTVEENTGLKLSLF